MQITVRWVDKKLCRFSDLFTGQHFVFPDSPGGLCRKVNRAGTEGFGQYGYVDANGFIKDLPYDSDVEVRAIAGYFQETEDGIEAVLSKGDK